MLDQGLIVAEPKSSMDGNILFAWSQKLNTFAVLAFIKKC